MKKLLIVLIAVILLVVGGIVLFPPQEKKGSGTEITKIGALLNGSSQDRSYSQAQYDAIKSVSEKTGLALECYEHVRADEAFSSKVEEMIRDGCGIIIGDTYLYDPYLKELAEKYPDVYFLNATGTETADNFSTYIGRVYQVRYLAGIVAGSQTKTGEIGYVIAFPTPETIRQLNAFTLGVKKANPAARVYVRYIEDWNDSEKAANVTNEMLDAHSIDVLTLHTNSIAPLQTGDERGVFTIGNNYDNHELFPNTYLTATVYNWASFLEERVKECQKRQFVGQHYWESIRTGLVSLAPLSSLVDSETKTLVEQEEERLMSGNFDVFYVGAKDIYGTLQTREGENISDEQLLYGMYWYVDGVVLE